MTDIARLRELALAATPGPWTIMGGELFCPSWPYWPEGEQREESRAKGHITVLCWPGDTPEEPDVVFRKHNETIAYIAALNPQAVLALLAELETLRDDIANIRGEKWSAIELAIAHGKAADLWQSLHGVTSLDALLERAETAEAELETSRAQVEGMRKALDALLHVCEREDPEQAIAPREMELARSLLTPASPGEDIDDG